MEVDSYYTEPYDAVTNEPLPESVVYTDSFRDLLAGSKKAVDLLREPLIHSSFSNVITNGLQKEIAKRYKEEQPEQVMFAVVGDMKAGKSSVINSILSIGTIARKGDGGDSCTWVVQRYMKMFQGQSSPFAAKVRFFDSRQIREVISSLLAKYYRAVSKADYDVDDEDNMADNEDSYVESFGEMQDTVAAFTAMFCDRDGFESVSATRKYLKQLRSENDERVLNTLVGWAEELVQAHLCDKDVVTFESATAEQLVFTKLQAYTYHVGTNGVGIPEPWPLVAVIDFGLDHPLLNEGIIFVDSPGLSDANTSRAQNAIQHHRECSHKIAVAEVGRAESDAALRLNLASGYRTKGSGSTILVLTHGDTIDPETEVTGTPAERTTVGRLNATLKSLRSENQKTRQARLLASLEDRDDYDDQLRAIATEMKDIQSERDCCRLNMRNRKVVSKMQELYKGLTGDPRLLPTFAVGNQVYQQYQTGFTADEKPYMSVKQTNIPDLRHRLYMMPIEGKLNETLHFVEVQLPNLVHSVELYCSQIYLARKAEMEAIILEPKTRLREVVHAAFDNLKETLSESLLEPMKSREQDWISDAHNVCTPWADEYNGNLTLIRNEGFRHGRKGKAEVNWNLELTAIGCDWIEEYLEDVQEKWKTWGGWLVVELQRLCMGTRDRIKNDRQFYTMALNPFLDSFGLKSRTFSKKIDWHAKRFDRDVRALKERATRESNDAFLNMVMTSIYEQAQQIKGYRAPAKRVTFIEREITRVNGLWMKLHDAIERGFDKLLVRHVNAVVESFEEIFDSIHRDFLLLCDDTDTKDEKLKVAEELLRNQLKENLLQVREMMDEHGDIPKLVAQCKAYNSKASTVPLTASG